MRLDEGMQHNGFVAIYATTSRLGAKKEVNGTHHKAKMIGDTYKGKATTSRSHARRLITAATRASVHKTKLL